MMLAALIFAAAATSPSVGAEGAIDWPAAWTQLVHALSWVAIASGSFFVLVGAIGMMRMPELFTRMHAASVIDTLGAGLLIGGLMIQAGPTLIALKLLFIYMLLFVTSPVATHALAQAALHDGIKPELRQDRTGTINPRVTASGSAHPSEDR